MEVILLEKVHNLGDLGDKVKVKPGYGRNYLIPAQKAVPATAENLARFEEQRAELEKAEADAQAQAERLAKAVEELSLVVAAKSGPEGKLFGSVGAAEIVDAAAAHRVELERKNVRLPEGPFRQVGDYVVEIALHADVVAELKLKVQGEEAAPGEEPLVVVEDEGAQAAADESSAEEPTTDES